MLEALNFEIWSVFWSVMLALLWILVEQLYSYSKPAKRSQELHGERNYGSLTKDNEDNSNQVNTNFAVEQSQSTTISEHINLPIIEGDNWTEINIDPDMTYISKEELMFNNNKGLSEPSNLKEIVTMDTFIACNITRQVETFQQQVLDFIAGNRVCRSTCVSTLERFTRFENVFEKEVGQANSFLLTEFDVGEIINLVQKISSQYESNLFKPQKREGCLSVIPCNSIVLTHFKNHRNIIKLSVNQIQSVLVTIHYMLTRMNTQQQYELFSDGHIKKNESAMEQSYPKLSLVQDKSEHTVSLPESLTEDIVTSRDRLEIDIVGGKKVKKCTKRRKKPKKSREEQKQAVFSSKQCLASLAYYMSSRRPHSHGSLLAEIQRQLRPIKEQISELRASMAEYSVVNVRHSANGVRSTTMCVQYAEKGSKTTLTTPSAVDYCYEEESSKMMLIVPSNHTTLSSVDCNVEFKSSPKTLSPLAEMYVKLSRHK